MHITHLLETGGGLKLLADMALSEQKQALLGQEFEGYTVDQYVSSGASGFVFKAHRSDGQFQREVAIKFLNQTILPDEGIQRFYLERHILAQLRHPNIAQLYDAGMTPGGVPFFIMEFVNGDTLEQYLKENQLSLDQKLALFRKIVDAVQHAHELQIIHRDIKLSNIMVSAEGEPRLIDFGIAKSEQLDKEFQFSQDPLTLQFASPEQILKAPVTQRSDVYQLGIILYYLLTGKYPFEDVDKLSIEARMRQGHTAASPYKRLQQLGHRALAAKVKGDVDAIVLKCMANEAEARYSNACELFADLIRYQQGQPIVARENTADYRIAKFVLRNRTMVAVALMFMVVLTIASSWFSISLQQANKQILQEKETAERVVALIGELFNSGSPFSDDKDKFDLQQVISQAEIKVDALATAEPEVASQLYYVLGNLHYELDQLAASQRLLNKVQNIEPDVYLQAQNLLIRHYLDSGENDKVKALIRQQESALTDPAQPVALAELYLLKARFYGEKDLFAQARQSANQALGLVPEVPNGRLLYARAHQVLAKSYVEAQDADQILFHINKVKLAVVELKGEHSLDLASVLASEASALLLKGQYGLAQQTYQQAIAMAETYDSGNRLVLQRLYNNVAALLYQQGDNIGAIEYIRKNRAILVSAYGGSHSKVIRASLNLAVTLTGIGRLEEARELLLSVVSAAGQSKVYPYAMSALGFIEKELGNYPQSEKYYADTLNYLGKTHGTDSPVYQKNIMFQLQSRCLAGATDGFQELVEKAARIIEAASGRDNYNFGLTLFSAGVCHQASNAPDAARQYFAMYKVLVESLSGTGSDYFAIINLQLAKLAAAESDYAAVKSLLNLDPAIFVQAPYIVSRLEILYLLTWAQVQTNAFAQARLTLAEIQQLLPQLDWVKPVLMENIAKLEISLRSN